MRLSIITAVSENGIIGKDGTLPWHLPADLKRFKEITSGSSVIMGRKTFEAIGKPLPNRCNIIVTGGNSVSRTLFNSGYHNNYVARSFDEAVKLAKADGEGNGEIFAIGGEGIYEEALKSASRLYYTLIHASIDGDTKFPSFNTDWLPIERTFRASDENNEHDMTWIVYERPLE